MTSSPRRPHAAAVGERRASTRRTASNSCHVERGAPVGRATEPERRRHEDVAAAGGRPTSRPWTSLWNALRPELPERRPGVAAIVGAVQAVDLDRRPDDGRVARVDDDVGRARRADRAVRADRGVQLVERLAAVLRSRDARRRAEVDPLVVVRVEADRPESVSTCGPHALPAAAAVARSGTARRDRRPPTSRPGGAGRRRATRQLPSTGGPCCTWRHRCPAP